MFVMDVVGVNKILCGTIHDVKIFSKVHIYTYTYMLWLYHTTCMLSVLLCKSEVMRRMTVNNNDISPMSTVGYNLHIYPKGLSQLMLLSWNNRHWFLVVIACQN